MIKSSKILPLTMGCAIALVISGATSGAMAAGYAIKEQSASALGNAFAGAAAVSDDISTMFFNPAIIGQHEGHQMLSSATYIVPTVEARNSSSTGAAGAVPGLRNLSDVGANAAVPALYGMVSVTDDIKVGIGVTAPWGLSTSHNEGWVGRYEALTSTVKTINVTPVVAYRVTDQISVAAGPQIQYIDAKLSSALDCGSVLFALAVPGAAPYNSDCVGTNEGDDIGVGWIAGVHGDFGRFGVGASYRSEIDHTLDGGLTFERPSPALSGLFPNTGVSAEVTTPEMINLGLSYDASDKLTLLAGATWTRWSRFEELRINFDRAIGPTGATASVTPENWDDVWSFALGATYRYNDTLTLRTGVAYDESPVSGNFRTPRIPDSDRYWLSMGASFEVDDKLHLDFGYTHIFIGNADVNKARNPADPTDFSLTTDYHNNVDILSVQGRYKF